MNKSHIYNVNFLEPFVSSFFLVLSEAKAKYLCCGQTSSAQPLFLGSFLGSSSIISCQNSPESKTGICVTDACVKKHPEATEKVNVEYVRLRSQMLLF